jgi:hypothetical protein
MEGFPVGRVLKKANPWDFPRRLGVGGERHHEDCAGEGDEESNGAVHHERVLQRRHERIFGASVGGLSRSVNRMVRRVPRMGIGKCRRRAGRSAEVGEMEWVPRMRSQGGEG